MLIRVLTYVNAACTAHLVDCMIQIRDIEKASLFIAFILNGVLPAYAFLYEYAKKKEI